MSKLIIILPDQISEKLPSLANIDQNRDVIFFYEYINLEIKHHPKKIAFLLTCMRRFAQKMQEQGYKVDTLPIDYIVPDFKRDIENIITKYRDFEVLIVEPSSFDELAALKDISAENKIEILEDTRFLATKSYFKNWAKDKKQLRMEFFYREMRKKYNILMNEGKPIGGIWNYDIENRNPPKGGLDFPKRISHQKSQILLNTLKMVHEKFGDNFGDLEPFYYATDKDEALLELDHFIEKILANFGEYQDAMLAGEAYMYHSLLSSYINNGLLDPLDIIKKAEASYHLNKAPLNAVEGFIRQILGWREYIRGIYWLLMPQYKSKNHLEADHPLPGYYWGKHTDMFCIKEAVNHTKIHAYSHHIQRLMITGNFALISGLNPDEVDNWYGAVYSDAYEWVHTPNTRGMSLFADGGVIASKPYASSGRYISKMSNYCKSCKYKVDEVVSENACPFNSLYWHFIDKHKNKFSRNQRMKYVYSTWDRMEPGKREVIISKAKNILSNLEKL